MAESIAPTREIPDKQTTTEVKNGPAAGSPIPSTGGRPASSYGVAPHDPSKPAVKRQIVCFSFYKVMPEWRRLPAEERAAHKAAFAEGSEQME